MKQYWNKDKNSTLVIKECVEKKEYMETKFGHNDDIDNMYVDGSSSNNSDDWPKILFLFHFIMYFFIMEIFFLFLFDKRFVVVVLIITYTM